MITEELGLLARGDPEMQIRKYQQEDLLEKVPIAG